ncbi:hypothetical protein HN604_03280 [archaeon]|nr:hypothetical protein [archaeon]MBT7661079.1 hypothetical protein [archaeon]
MGNFIKKLVGWKFSLVYLLIVVGLSFFATSAAFNNNAGSGFDGSTSNWQYYEPSFNQLYSGDVSTYWPIIGQLDGEQCEATSDFAVMIPPGGCSPAVVRSDLLAEQNVPVFCQLQSVQLNPLIEVSSIKSISFKGDYPEGVSGISFHPARAATKSYRTLLGNPVINNIGYVVIIVKQNKIEANLEEWVAGNLTASIRYDAEEAFGVGQAEYYLPTMSDSEWEKNYVKNAFWKGKGYLRLADVNKNSATIQIYNSKDNVYRTITLQEGQTSDLSYFPGYYCMAGMKVKLHKVEAPEDSVLLNIDGQESWYGKGSKFLNGKCSVSSMDIAENSTGSIKLSCPGQSIDLKLMKREGTLVDANDVDTDSDFQTSFDIVVKELVEDYGAVKKDALLETFGEEALIEQIEIAGELKKFKTMEILLDLFLDTYPESSSYNVKFQQKQNLGLFDYSSAYSNVLVTNELHTIGISEFNKINNFSKNVTLEIGSQTEKDRHEGDVIDLGDGNLTIVKVDVGEIKLSFKSKDSSKVKSGSTKISEGEYGTLGGRDIKIAKIDLKELAYVSLIPEVKNTKTEAEFTFRVGIEKRLIELNPERTEKMLVNLNASIDKWNDINERLGGVIKTWKAACFATSSYLMLKNVVSGFSGEGLARQKVMGNYKTICAGKIANGEFETQTQCYNAFSEDIDRDVTTMTTALSNVNGDIEDVHSSGDYVEDGILGDKINNNEAYLVDLRNKLDSKYPNGWSKTVNGQPLDSSDLTTSSQIRAALLSEKFGGEGINGEIADVELDNILKSTASTKEAQAKTDALQGQYNYNGVNFPASALSGGQGSVINKTLTVSKSELLGALSGNANLVEERLEDKGNLDKVGVQIVQSDNAKDYLYVLEEDGKQLGIFEVKKSATANTLEVLSAPDKLAIPDGKSVRIVSGGECSNVWSESNAKVKFYQSGENKGLPAIVPFDLTHGWYAMVPNSQGTFLENAPQGYQASGQVSYFKICNVGTNGLEESGTSDDFCQSFSAASIGSVTQFPHCSGMTPTDVRNLYDRAVSTIKQVSSKSGQKNWLIDGKKVELGNPASFSGALECQDFMSPDDCLLMFNTCDPVICPSSRCDLGGKMPVADVIQTGIVGSLMLCLPNAKEGIYVPICLSGVHAGIDAYVSILDSEKACLERSLETGEHVGICDEITSIYKCEFFWKQAAPITELAFQKLIGGFTGSSSPDGGGEYLFIPSAFDNLENSLSYFKNTYAPNAFKAFEVRNVEEAGTEFCQAFIGTSFPTSAEAFDSLLEPESPTQFYARFSEDTLSDVTVPATAHYKVYYHIFAGNDKGVQYRVYLQDPPQSGYYSVNPTVSVKTGYIARGETRDEAIDFTAPEGYKELCVVIDAETYCGFGSVTTDVGLKLVKEAFVEDQASQEDITTEKECIAGTPGLLNLGDPEIISQGIVRICSNEIEGSSRWKDVGYCGEESFRCYLDTESVLDNLQTLSAFGNYTINELGENKNLVDSLIKTNEEVRALLGVVKDSISELQVSGFVNKEKEKEVLDTLNGIIGTEGPGYGDNRAKARALFLKATLYWGKIRLSLDGAPKVEPAPRETEVFGVLSSGDVLRDIETAWLYDVVVDDLDGDVITFTLTLRGGDETDWETFEKNVGEHLAKDGEGFELFFGALVEEEETDADPGLSLKFSQLNETESIVELSTGKQFIILTIAEKNNGAILVIKLKEVLETDSVPETKTIEVSPDQNLKSKGYTFYFTWGGSDLDVEKTFGDLELGSTIKHIFDGITYTLQSKEPVSGELIEFKIISEEGATLTFILSSTRTLKDEGYGFISS